MAKTSQAPETAAPAAGRKEQRELNLGDARFSLANSQRHIAADLRAPRAGGELARPAARWQRAAACWFAERGGGLAAIGSIEDTQALLRGEAGTRVELATAAQRADRGD